MRARRFGTFRTGLAVVAALAAGLLSGPVAAETPQSGGTLTVGFQGDSKTFNPIHSIQWTERQVLYLVYNTLLRMGPDFSLNPELAESWDIAEDGKKIVLHLRQGVKFHDGTDFDAAAVKWNFDQRMDPEVGSPQIKQLDGVVESVETVDDHTVAINLVKPFAPFLSLLAERPGFMVSPTAAQKAGEDFGNHPVGTGPFIFKEWTRGTRIVVERNPDYWEEGLPYLDSVVFSDIAGAIIGVQRLITGEIDFIDSLSPKDVQQLEGNSDIKLDPITVGRWYSFQWQWDREPFNNPKLRKAIAHAIDRDRMNQITMGGKATISDSPTPPGLWWHDAELDGYEYDPEKAKQLVAEANLPDDFVIQLATPEDAILRQLNQLAAEQLTDVGLTVELVPVAQSEWYSRVVEKAINFTPMRWTQRPDPDGLLSILFASDGYANSTGYKNERVDELLRQAAGTFDQSKRVPLYREAQQHLLEDLPYVPVYFSVEFAAMSTTVMGFQWTPDQIPRFYNVWKAK